MQQRSASVLLSRGLFGACRWKGATSSAFTANGFSKLPSLSALRLIAPPVRPYHRSTFDANPDVDGAVLGEVVLVDKHGVDILHDPLFNKGTGFPLEERERLGLRGLVPPREYSKDNMANLEIQARRVMKRYEAKLTDMDKYNYLISLQDRNETLFYKVLKDNLRKMAPIIYTPTVGKACLTFSSNFRRSRGMYFSANDKGHMHAMTWNFPYSDVQIIVVTDGSRILGLGDLGANGMGIPIGKLSLYTACAGIHPSRCLPVFLDAGTNNEEILKDDFYLGLAQKRLKGAPYDVIVDEFMRAVNERWPKAVIHFEDFSNENAERLLSKYRDRYLCFNDDIQGTGTVVLASCLSAMRVIAGKRISAKESARLLSQQRIVVVGAGTAGLGVTNCIRDGMTAYGHLSDDAACKNFVLYDRDGSMGAGRIGASSAQRPYIHDHIKDKMDLLETVRTVKPTIMIGLTGIPNVFSEAAIREMAKYCERPLVLPLSNPTDRAECSAAQAYEWTDGRAIFASGSPFGPVEYKGKKLVPNQSNNMYSFPGIGLGAISCGAKKITRTMLQAASVALAETMSDEDLSAERLFPPIEQITDITIQVATALARTAYREGLASVPWDGTEESLVQLVKKHMWNPHYGSFVSVRA